MHHMFVSILERSGFGGGFVTGALLDNVEVGTCKMAS
jgi:hypothetical protein